MIAATLNTVRITKFFLSTIAFSMSFESSEITMIFLEKVKTLSDPNILKLSLIILLSKIGCVWYIVYC